MAVTRVSHSCLLIELGPILWQHHCALRVVRITANLKAIMEVYGKTFTGLGPIYQAGGRPRAENE